MGTVSDFSVFLSYLHFVWFRHRDLHAYWERYAPIGNVRIAEDMAELSSNSSAFLDRVSIDLWLRSEQIGRIRDRMEHSRFNSYFERFSSSGIQCLLAFSDLFPRWLLQLKDPPFILYFLWSLEPISASPLKIAVVWSRESTPYGESILRSFLPELVRSWVSIISGGALWIDGVAHRSALDLGGYTIAVLGSWINRPYPKRNESLFSEIISRGGGVISHFPFDTEAAPYTFPIRNEIIAGISDGIFVVEAKERSGSLITAYLGLELGKEIFAPPSDIGRWNSLGTNRLIQKSGAKLVLGPGDILEEFGLGHSASSDTWKRGLGWNSERIPVGSDIGRRILGALEQWAASSNSLVEQLWLELSELQIELWKMEIQGTIVRNSTWAYSLNHG